MRLTSGTMTFTGKERPKKMTLTTTCKVKGCYRDIPPGEEFVEESHGFRAHLVCAAKTMVKNG